MKTNATHPESKSGVTAKRRADEENTRQVCGCHNHHCHARHEPVRATRWIVLSCILLAAGIFLNYADLLSELDVFRKEELYALSRAHLNFYRKDKQLFERKVVLAAEDFLKTKNQLRKRHARTFGGGAKRYCACYAT